VLPGRQRAERGERVPRAGPSPPRTRVPLTARLRLASTARRVLAGGEARPSDAVAPVLWLRRWAAPRLRPAPHPDDHEVRRNERLPRSRLPQRASRPDPRSSLPSSAYTFTRLAPHRPQAYPSARPGLPGTVVFLQTGTLWSPWHAAVTLGDKTAGQHRSTSCVHYVPSGRGTRRDGKTEPPAPAAIPAIVVRWPWARPIPRVTGAVRGARPTPATMSAGPAQPGTCPKLTTRHGGAARLPGRRQPPARVAQRYPVPGLGSARRGSRPRVMRRPPTAEVIGTYEGEVLSRVIFGLTG
jgi:hypothetical protein